MMAKSGRDASNGDGKEWENSHGRSCQNAGRSP